MNETAGNVEAADRPAAPRTGVLIEAERVVQTVRGVRLRPGHLVAVVGASGTGTWATLRSRRPAGRRG